MAKKIRFKNENVARAAARSTSRRLAKWQAHLVERGVTTPDVEDFRTFGRISSLERLRDVLADVAPDQCGPLARVISELRREKRSRGASCAKGGVRGKERELSISEAELPPDWRATLADMRRRRKALEAGMIDLGDVAPPALSQIRAMEYVLCCIAKVCLDADRPMDIDAESVTAWLDRQEARKQRETGLSHQLRKLREFLIYRGEKKALRKRLASQAARYAHIGRQRRKCKHDWLLNNRTDIGKVWEAAEDLLDKSRKAKAGTSRRYLLALHAAAIALPIAVPLRIGDLHRLQIGKEIVRDANGWALAIVTKKTTSEYERPELWPELTKFLDELLIMEAPGGDLWAGYDRREGTPLFSRDGGVTALSADWISDVWYEHVGIGEHIIRTLWHEVAYDSDTDRTWMALALCGQKGRRTADEYREAGKRRRAVRAGRERLMTMRQAVRNEALLSGDGGI